MSSQMDPEEREVEAIRSLGELGEARTLELGCGYGRLASRLHSLASPVYGIDPSLDSILAGRTYRQAEPRLVVADARSLPFRDGSFDQAVFGWSL